MSDQPHPDTHPGVITLPQAYRERTPCPLCKDGTIHVTKTPQTGGPLAQPRSQP